MAIVNLIDDNNIDALDRFCFYGNLRGYLKAAIGEIDSLNAETQNLRSEIKKFEAEILKHEEARLFTQLPESNLVSFHNQDTGT